MAEQRNASEKPEKGSRRGSRTKTGTSGRPGPAKPGEKSRAERQREIAEREAEALRLRARGRTYQQIGEHFGVTYGTAADLVKRALAKTVRQEAADELREVERAKLDEAEAAVWLVLERHHVVVSHGKVVYHGSEPLKDDGPVLNAVDRLMKIWERRAKLEGLDAPTQVEVLTVDKIDAEIQRLSNLLNVDPESVDAE